MKDYSHVSRVQNMAAKTLYAGFVSNNANVSKNNNLVRMGGGADASIAVLMNSGPAAVGATDVGQAPPASSAAYSISQMISELNRS
jgi:hypothetical protein